MLIWNYSVSSISSTVGSKLILDSHCPGSAQCHEYGGPSNIIAKKVRSCCIKTFVYLEIFKDYRGKKEAYPGQ